MGRAGDFRGAIGLLIALLSASAAGSETEPDGERRLFEYAASCALPRGVSVKNPFSRSGEQVSGELGLAPAWQGQALDAAARRLVSACILARLNLLGVHVQIELRPAREYFGAQAGVPEENFEGAYFGDLFATPPRMYACTGSAAQHENSIQRGRRCALPAGDDGRLSPCGLQLAGTCRREAFMQDGEDFLDSALLVFVPG